MWNLNWLRLGARYGLATAGRPGKWGFSSISQPNREMKSSLSAEDAQHGGPGMKENFHLSLFRPFCGMSFIYEIQDSFHAFFLHQYKESKDVFILGSVSFSGRWSSQHRERHKNIEMLFHLRTSFFLHYTRYQQEIKESGKSSVERGPVNEISLHPQPPNHRKTLRGTGEKFSGFKGSEEEIVSINK